MDGRELSDRRGRRGWGGEQGEEERRQRREWKEEGIKKKKRQTKGLIQFEWQKDMRGSSCQEPCSHS